MSIVRGARNSRRDCRPSDRAHLVVLALAGLLGFTAACQAGPRDERGPAEVAIADTTAVRRPVRIDSIFPIDEQIRRYREGLTEATALEGGAESRAELVRNFIAGLSGNDSAAVLAARITRQEFIYLFYPYTKYTSRPYELEPGLLWFQMENASSRGVHRAFQKLGGKELLYHNHGCDEEPEIEEDNRIWTGCVVTLAIDGAPPEPLALFGPILERHGHYKFISFANQL